MQVDYVTDILAHRLFLKLMSVAALEATKAHDLARVENETGLYVSPEWLELSWLADMRLEQIKNDPDYALWSIRAISLRNEPAMVGFINCHGPPKQGRMELGYEIFPKYQRRGFAFEAISAFLQWAKQQGVTEVVFSISPGNKPSLALNEKFGAQKIGSHIDEKDGPEDIYLLQL